MGWGVGGGVVIILEKTRRAITGPHCTYSIQAYVTGTGAMLQLHIMISRSVSEAAKPSPVYTMYSRAPILYFSWWKNVIKWKPFLRYWPFVRRIHRSLVNSHHKNQWGGALRFSLICVRTNGWINNRDDRDLGSNRAHYDVTLMSL